jgi:two-component system, OmpR family, sensor histidine kinase MtrB
MVDALTDRIERDARFVSDVSHELRSPLTTLAMAASVLQTRRGQLSERDQIALDLLVDEVNRFEQVLGELLELSRVDAGAAPLALEPVRLDELVHHVIGSRPDFPVDADPLVATEFVLVDKRRIERVLVNLLDNARTHGGGVASLSIHQADGRVQIAVSDRGPGVDPADRDRVFERFSRGAAAGRRGDTAGAGLGLSLVREHVRLHGGTVWVEDGPDGRGARFVVELPWEPV